MSEAFNFSPKTHRAEGQRPLILHVEDNEARRYAVAHSLRRAGFDVIEACSGEEGLLLAERDPDLIVLDINLPGISGFEVCRRLKSSPSTRRIPVLHLSAANVLTADKTLGLDLGADAYLAEPVEVGEFLSTIKALLRVRKSEEQAYALAKRWEISFAAISDGICLLTVDGTVAECNPGMSRLLGKSRNALLGQKIHSVLPEGFGAGADALASFVRMPVSDGEIECKLGERWFRITVSMVEDSGLPIGAVVVMAEITEKKANSQKIEEQARLLDLTQDALVVVDAEDRIVFWNRGAQSVFGFSATEAMGRNVHALLRTDSVEPVADLKRNCHLSGRWRGELVQYAKDGAKLQVASRWVVDGDTLRTLQTSTDISHRKNAEEELLRLTKSLSRSNAELDQFASTISHDLQEPLRTVASFVSLLDRRGIAAADPQAREFMQFAVDGSLRMKAMIEDLLHYSRFTTEVVIPELLDANAIIAAALNNLGLAVEESGAEILYEDLPNVYGDQGQLTRLFQNLIGNAIKFRKGFAPKIQIKANLSATAVVFSISDDGIGFVMARAERIFQIFQRLHARHE